MRVTLETPVTWMDSDRDGERHRLMYATLKEALRRAGVSVLEVDTHYGSDFYPRTAPADGVLLSYHSVGNSANVWRIKETPIPYYYSIDKFGYSGWSELSVNLEEHLARIQRLDVDESEAFRKGTSDWLRAGGLSKYAQGNDPLPVGDGFIFLPLQVTDDAVAIHNKIAPMTVLRHAAWAAWRFKKPLVVKRHPYCSSHWVNLNLILNESLNPYVFATNASVLDIIAACDAVLVGNSGVGLEAIVHGKPAYSFARSEYDAASFKVDEVSDIGDLFAMSSHAPHPRSSTFVSYFLQERCFDARSGSDTSKKVRRVLEEAS